MPSHNTYCLTWVSLTLGGVSLHGCSSKAHPLLLTLDEGYLLTAASPDLECVVAPIDYAKAFDVWYHEKLWIILKEKGIADHLVCQICMQVKKEQLELDVEKQTHSKSGEEYVKAVYFHLDYLTYMQNTSRSVLGWMKHKL